MSLTEREKEILKLSQTGLTDYQVARHIRADAANVTASRKNALRKLEEAKQDLAWAQQNGILAKDLGR